MNDTRQSPTLAQWESLYNDRVALVQSPEGQQFALNEVAQALCEHGVIDAATLGDLLEQADAAYQWAMEEHLSLELNSPDSD